MNLHEEISGIFNYKVNEKYIITGSKNSISLYDIKSYRLLSKSCFGLYPKVNSLNKDSFLIQNATNLIELDYSLNIKETLSFNIPNIWRIQYITDYCALFKQHIGNNIFKILKYDIKKENIFWETYCDNYKFCTLNSVFFITDSNNSKNLQNIDIESGKILWNIELDSIISQIHLSNKATIEITDTPLVNGNIVIVKTLNIEDNYTYVLALNLFDGSLIWFSKDYNTIELYENKLYSIEFDGLLRILNIENGNVESKFDLSEEFKNMNINCAHHFNITDTHIYFKHGRKGKFGIINLKNMELEEVHQLPEGNTISTEEYPIPDGNKLYIKSSPQNNLFIYE